MTLDETIERFTSNAEYERTHGNLQGFVEFRKLVEWLKDYKRLKEQEPCEDAISREDALMALTGEWTEITDEIIHRFIKRIKTLPSVKPQERTGYWEWVQYDSNPNIGNWHCSECRNIVSDMPTCMGKPLYEFCPNCGCPMEIER